MGKQTARCIPQFLLKPLQDATDLHAMIVRVIKKEICSNDKIFTTRMKALSFVVS